MTTKKNEGDAPEEKTDAPVEDPNARPLSMFDIARNADLRFQAEQAAKKRQASAPVAAEGDESGAPRMAGKEQTEFVDTPFSLTHHRDGSAKRMVICRPNGTGEREVTVEEWDRMNANPNLAPGSWTIKFTEVVAPNHSENF